MTDDAAPPAICPQCGYSLLRDIAVRRGPYVVGPTFVLYQGQGVRLSPQRTELLYALARNYPRPVSSEVLLNRIAHSDADGSLVAVQMSHLRRLLRRAGLPVPVETVWGGTGYVWSMEPVLPQQYSRGKRQ